jgi:uncharacterized membrane protein YqiK
MVEIIKKKFINIPEKKILIDLKANKTKEDDYIYINYIICIIIIVFIIIFFSRRIYLNQKEIKKIIKTKEERKGYKKVNILKK